MAKKSAKNQPQTAKSTRLPNAVSVALDYGEVGNAPLMENLSGVAGIGAFLWSVSDEGRTVECLKRQANGGYQLSAQYKLDEWIADIPGRKTGDELDLESIDIAGGRLWLCGSHCNVRKKPKANDTLNCELRKRPSRHLLASIKLKDGGGQLGKAVALPFKGSGSLRSRLLKDPFLKPFRHLPSKENGLDIEGFVIHGGRMFLGLRGPLVDSVAVVAAIDIEEGFEPVRRELNFLDLGGLAVRDLAKFDGGLLILAGPMSDGGGRFQLYLWDPVSTPTIQKPVLAWEWPEGHEKPEGICLLQRDDRPGLLIVYDSPDRSRFVSNAVYTADWVPLT